MNKKPESNNLLYCWLGAKNGQNISQIKRLANVKQKMKYARKKV